MNRLAQLRLRLTTWYAGTLGLILLLLGAGLFAVIRGQIAHQLDRSLEGAVNELMRAADIREREATFANSQVVDAVDELRIPDRVLYLLDANGQPLKPPQVDGWVAPAARAASDIPSRFDVDEKGGPHLRVVTRRFQTPGGTAYIGIAAADRQELADKYAALIAAFGGAAFVAIVLVAGGGYVLVRQSTAPVERAMEYMRRFMADAAHELRTPLSVLRTRAEVTLQRDRDSREYVAALGAIGREAERLGGIVDDLLLLARADAGERPLQRARLHLDDLVLDVAGGAGVVAERRGVRLDLDRLEEAEVEGDPALVRQLISIVVDNAVKFTPAGGRVQLGVACGDGGPHVVVEDTGPGIPAEQIPHIFERFYRGDPARSRADGAGLGLSIARWIADAHSAQIDVASQPGQGTRVSIRFPPAVSAS